MLGTTPLPRTPSLPLLSPSGLGPASAHSPGMLHGSWDGEAVAEPSSGQGGPLW